MPGYSVADNHSIHCMEAIPTGSEARQLILRRGQLQELLDNRLMTALSSGHFLVIGSSGLNPNYLYLPCQAKIMLPVY